MLSKMWSDYSFCFRFKDYILRSLDGVQLYFHGNVRLNFNFATQFPSLSEELKESELATHFVKFSSQGQV